MKHKGLIIIIGLLIFLVTIGSALAIKPADLEKKLEWKGENLSVYPINTEVDIPLDYIEFKDIKQSAKDNDLKFKNLGANTIGIDKKDIEHFRIKSSQSIYQVRDIRETHEWGYLGTGYGVDTITAKGNLVQKGQYICIDEPVISGEGLNQQTVYNDCVYYPQVYENVSITPYYDTVAEELKTWELRPQVNLFIDGNTATINYPLPYDPLTSNYTSGLVSCWSFDSDATDDHGTNDGTVSGATHITTGQKLGGGAYNFSSGNKITVSDVDDLDFGTGDFTIVFWAKSNQPSGFNYFMGKGDTGTGEWMLRVTDNSAYDIYSSGGTVAVVFSPAMDASGWNMYTYRYNSTSHNIAVNNTWDGGPDTTNADLTSAKDLIFGNPDLASRYFVGLLDEVMIWKGTALTDAEIIEIYNSGTGSTCAEIIATGGGSPPAADTTPPVISSVLNSSLTNSSALITWSTDENADSKVYYGLTGSYGSTNSTASLVTSHSINLYSLTSNTTYYYLVESCDNVSNCANSSQYSFTTNTTPTTPAGDNESTINFTTTELHTANTLTGVNYLVDTGRNVSGVIYWDLDNNFLDSGTGDASSEDLNSHTGTNTFVDGRFGNALYCDGSSRHQHSGGNLFDTNIYTIGLWYKTTDTSGHLLSYTDLGTTDDYEIRILTSGGGIQVYSHTTTGYYTLTGGSGTNNDEWHNLVLTFNGTNQSLYIDGDYITSDTVETPSGTGSTTQYFNLCTRTASPDYVGSIDEVTIYKSVLTQEEINKIMYQGYRLNDSENIVLDPGTYNVTATKTGYYDLTQEATVSYDTDETITLTGMYDTILTITVIDANSGLAPSGTTYLTLDDYAANYNSTNGSFLLNTVSGTTSYTFYNTLYVDSTQNNTIVSPTDNFTVNLYTSNSLSLTFRDSLTESLINIVTVNYFSEADSGSNATTNGTLYLELLNPTTYTFILNSSGYHDNFYFVTIIDDTSEEITMYLNPEGNTTELTVSVIDGGLSPISNAIVKALKYYVSDNTYRVVASGITNPDGEILMNLATGSEFYKFVVLIDDVIVKTTTPFLITGTTLSIQVLLEDNVLETYREGTTIDRSLLFNTVSDSFRFDFTDANSVSRTICLNTYRKGVLLHTVVNSTCTTGTSGTILHAVTNISGVTYYSKATTSINSETVVLEQEEYTFSKGDIGNSGLLMQIALTIILSLSGFLAVELLFLLAPLSLVVGGFAGLHNIPLTFTVPLLIIGIIIMFMLRRNN